MGHRSRVPQEHEQEPPRKRPHFIVRPLSTSNRHEICPLLENVKNFSILSVLFLKAKSFVGRCFSLSFVTNVQRCRTIIRELSRIVSRGQKYICTHIYIYTYILTYLLMRRRTNAICDSRFERFELRIRPDL